MYVHFDSIWVVFACQFLRLLCRTILPPLLDWTVASVRGKVRPRRAATFSKQKNGVHLCGTFCEKNCWDWDLDK